MGAIRQEKRYFEIKLRNLEENDSDQPEIPVFTGKAIIYDKETQICKGIFEKIQKDAFTDAIERDDVRCLFNHNPNYVLGRNKSGTLKLEKREDALYFTVFPPHSSWCEDLKNSVKRGDISQCSFAFSTENDEFKLDKDGNIHRTVLDGKLYDISIVTYPAYEETHVALRSRVDTFKQLILDKENLANKVNSFLEIRN